MIFFLPLYFIGVNLNFLNLSILFIPFFLYIISHKNVNNKKVKSYLLINLVLLLISPLIYEDFNYSSFIFFQFFSILFFLDPPKLHNRSIIYLIIFPFFIYILDLLFPFIDSLSFIEHHNRTGSRLTLIFSEPSMMALYYLILFFLFNHYLKKHFILKYIIIGCIFLTFSISGLAILFVYFISININKNFFKLLFLIPIAVILLIQYLPDLFLERILYIISFDFFLTDYNSSIGNRLNSFFFLIEYYSSNGFNIFGQGWNLEESWINREYAIYSFTDLGNGNIKNLLSHFFYFIGVWGIFIIAFIFKYTFKSTRGRFIFLCFCFSYNWLTHPLFYFFIMSIMTYEKYLKKNQLII
jgi:hypothetical protein